MGLTAAPEVGTSRVVSMFSWCSNRKTMHQDKQCIKGVAGGRAESYWFAAFELCDEH